MCLFETLYKKILIKRYDDNHIIHYFSHKDFDNLKAENINFITDEGLTIRGNFYFYTFSFHFFASSPFKDSDFPVHWYPFRSISVNNMFIFSVFSYLVSASIDNLPTLHPATPFHSSTSISSCSFKVLLPASTSAIAFFNLEILFSL